MFRPQHSIMKAFDANDRNIVEGPSLVYRRNFYYLFFSGVYFTNIFRTRFPYENAFLAQKFCTKLAFWFEILAPKILYKKCVHKTLMKLRQVSISPTFFARVFHLKTHFWHKNSVQSWLFGLKFWRQKFCTKNACIKR